MSAHHHPIRREKNSIKPGSCNKIPTIISGRVVNDEIKNPLWPTKHPARVPSKKINKYNHKVKIIGDSHLRGSAVNINQYLNMKFEVSSFIKLGAGINQLIHSKEIELLRLRKKDVIVINGGSNNISNNNANRNEIFILLTQFIQKYSNTNIIVINIPLRHGHAKDFRTNSEIQAFNTKLGKVSKLFRHVALVEMNFNREHCTKHGFHLNNAGKESFVKLIAS